MTKSQQSNGETVLLTGVTGFIAKHICVHLLDAGYNVRGSLRSLDRADEVHDTISEHVKDKHVIGDRLSFIELDLSKDEGWKEAMIGVDILMHTASPFPLDQPEDENEVIKPAVDGALRAVRAAHTAGIKRIIMTSSIVAITDAPKNVGETYNETDWTDVNANISPYAKSKTLAEQAVWNYGKEHAPDIAITMINPGFVLGPALDGNYGTSLRVVERLLDAKDPAIPNFGFSTVHVTNIAQMHVSAIDKPESYGKRIAGVAEFLWFPTMAKMIAETYPNMKIVTRIAPNFVVKILSIFDKTIRQVVPNLGVKKHVSNQRARDILGIEFIPVKIALQESAATILEYRAD